MRLQVGRFAIIAFLGILVVAMCSQSVLVRSKTLKRIASQNPVRIKDLFQVADGWMVQDIPLSNDPFEERRTYELLNFDEVLYKAFSNGSTSFSLLIAHWKNTSMAAHEIASHTPDKCWYLRGWSCSKYMMVEGAKVGLAGMPMGYWREYHDPNKQSVFVMYWHLVDGELQDYGGNRLNFAPGIRYWLRTSFAGITEGAREQYFIRLTSDQGFERLGDSIGFQNIVGQLRRVGLRSPRK